MDPRLPPVIIERAELCALRERARLGPWAGFIAGLLFAGVVAALLWALGP